MCVCVRVCVCACVCVSDVGDMFEFHNVGGLGGAAGIQLAGTGVHMGENSVIISDHKR